MAHVVVERPGILVWADYDCICNLHLSAAWTARQTSERGSSQMGGWLAERVGARMRVEVFR